MIALNFCPVTVNDVDEAAAFYRDALGFAILNDVSNGEFRWLTLGDAGGAGTKLVLSQPHAGRSAQDGDALQESLLVKGVLPPLVFATDDVDAAFERARATGAEVLQEPTEQPWGPRDCAFRDPSGNMLRITAVA